MSVCMCVCGRERDNVDKSLTIFESIEMQGCVRGQCAMSQGLCWFSCITDSLVGAYINNII
jgi:hypothetical protein